VDLWYFCCKEDDDNFYRQRERAWGGHEMEAGYEGCELEMGVGGEYVELYQEDFMVRRGVGSVFWDIESEYDWYVALLFYMTVCEVLDLRRWVEVGRS